MKTFANLNIAPKLLVSFAAVLLLTVILGIFSIRQLNQVNQAAVELGSNWMPSVRAVLAIKGDIWRLRAQETQLLLADTDTDRDTYGGRMKQALAAFDKDNANYAQLISEPAEKARYVDFSRLWSAYLAEDDKIVQLARGGKDDEAKILIRGESSRLNAELGKDIDELAQINIDGGIASQKNGTTVFETARLWIFAILGVCLLLGAALAVWIAGKISRPLMQALQVAETVAAGDLTSRIEAANNDETGRLIKALKKMNGSLLDIVSRVRLGTDAIATSSSEIASGNLDLSARTEQQASSLEETASSMEELTSTVKQNAENARQANTLAASASAVAVRGGEVVGRVVETMSSINASSRKIVDIIGVIDGIAFQTNILALNAAVEAARAGEQGRGFAVVATEVRNLAQRSAAAAKEIKALIDDSVNKVDAGSELVDQAGLTMGEIVTSVQRVTDIMAEISSATREQELGIEQINQAIGEMDTVTQQNAALVEEAAAASESMQEQAQKLAQVVGVFKVGKGDDGAAPRARLQPRMAALT
jgi:methyl-accepting chemotaxis protein